MWEAKYKGKLFTHWGTIFIKGFCFCFLIISCHSSFVVSLILHICRMSFIRFNFFYILTFPSSPIISIFHPQHTIVSILVDIPQGCYSCAEASEGVRTGEGDRVGERERGHLQVQVNSAHLPGFALHLPLHVQGCSDQHVVHPGEKRGVGVMLRKTQCVCV